LLAVAKSRVAKIMCGGECIGPFGNRHCLLDAQLVAIEDGNSCIMFNLPSMTFCLMGFFVCGKSDLVCINQCFLLGQYSAQFGTPDFDWVLNHQQAVGGTDAIGIE
jgi:hypothetical protein